MSYEFSSVSGFFAQADPKTDDSLFDHLTSHFGRLASSWPEFLRQFEKLRAGAGPNTKYKLLFLARHGQGFHNLAIEIHGQKEWDEYWAALDGDDKMTWGPDAELTELGVEQAKANHRAWKAETANKIPMPQRYYVSPFTRAIDTMQYTWTGISYGLSDLALPAPLVKETLREDMGVHTCDKRRTGDFIRSRFPLVTLEPGFVNDDVLWKPDHRETPDEHDSRTREFLSWLFDQDAAQEHTVISVTSHSGTINSFLRVIGHRRFSVLTGGMIPVIVRAEKLTGSKI